ncbi:OprO/OprP family phosphate-selective porin [Isoalcanivorax indicus]|uniref:OprO/OprP family phosphate-selective porin n=1 Tax=Isoalcanivorax indicus TaxID=2202653 RepID=UPI000DB97A25|nr:porin [Isoalcanivorax indicus]
MKAPTPLFSGLLLLLSAMPAVPLADTTDDLIRTLLEKGILSEEDAAALRAEPPVVDRHPGMNYEPTTRIEDELTRMRVNKFRVETADGAHRFGVRGRVMVDHARVQDPFKSTDDDRLDRGDLGRSGTIIRRARLALLGLAYDRWEWQMEVDFRDPVTYDIEEGDDIEGIRFANTYLAYLFDEGRLAVGYFKEPFSLESSTSSRRISFIERASPVDAYRPDRQLGVMYETLRPDWYAALGLFGTDVSRRREVNEGWSVAGRSSFAPYMDVNRGIWSHLGVSANYRSNSYVHEKSRGRERDYDSVRMRSRLGTRAIDGRVIGRRDFQDVKYFATYALEAAYGVGPLSFQGEYLLQDLRRDANAQGFTGDPTTDPLSLSNGGYYVQSSYFLTGERRHYRAFSGDFGQTRVLQPINQGGWGAWELLARYAYADQTDHHDERGAQELDHYTLGVNWYPVDDIVVKFNAMYVDASTSSRDLPAGETKDWTSMVYALRVQFEF